MRRMTLSRLVLMLLAAAYVPSPARAAGDPAGTPIWVNAGLQSYHFRRDKDYREQNWGIGAEALFAPDHALMLGTYLNSENVRSRYFGYQWRPFHWQPGGLNVSTGVAASLIDGYPTTNNRGWFLTAFPMVAVEGKWLGANVLLLPNLSQGAVLAVQLKLRVW
jgi:hypothetical protein